MGLDPNEGSSGCVMDRTSRFRLCGNAHLMEKVLGGAKYGGRSS